MTLSVWRDEGLDVDLGEAHTLIIGAGITGLAIAWTLAQHGKNACILEANDLASGATGRNAGFAMTGLAEHYDVMCEARGRDEARALWHASQRNLQMLVQTVIPSLECDPDLVSCGSVIAAWNDEEARHIAQSARMLREDTFDARLIEGSELEARTGSSRFQRGLFVPGDHGVHPVKLVRALAGYVERQGTTIKEHHEVRSLDARPGDHVVVHTRKGRMRARHVVIATNAYAPQLVPWLGRFVRPVRGQALCTEPISVGTIPALVYTDDGFQYARQRPDGRIVAGGCRRDHARTEVGYEDAVTEPVQQGIEAFLHEAWPASRGADVTHRWSGVMGFSVDGVPLVGAVPHAPRVKFCVGFTGHGMGFAFEASKALITLMKGESSPSPFNVQRVIAQ